METISERRWSIVPLILLIIVDFIFIGVEILYSLGYAGDYRYSLGADRGYAEVYGYIKFFWIVLHLGWLVFKKRQLVYGVAALLFFYFLLDDSLQIHERVGGQIAEWTGMMHAYGLRGKDFGELAVSALAGLFFLVTGWLAYRYSNTFARRAGLYLLVSVLALAVFGVGADVLHQLVGDRFPWTNTPLLILEDGGELIVISAICWFVYSLADQELFPPQIRSPFV